MPHVHRGRPAHAGAPGRVPDAADGGRRGAGNASHQVNGVLGSDLPVEAALRAHRTVRLPSHAGTVPEVRDTARFRPVGPPVRVPRRADGRGARPEGPVAGKGSADGLVEISIEPPYL